jgi:hypothetical protein
LWDFGGTGTTCGPNSKEEIAVAYLIGAVLLGALLIAFHPSLRASLEARREAKEAFERFASLSPRKQRLIIEAREAEREAELEREWAQSPDEFARSLALTFPSWDAEDIAEMVHGRMIAKLECGGIRGVAPFRVPTREEIAEVDQWAARFIAANSTPPRQ